MSMYVFVGYVSLHSFLYQECPYVALYSNVPERYVWVYTPAFSCSGLECVTNEEGFQA